MKLYYAPASSYSQRVLIALYEKQINFDAIEVNLFDPFEACIIIEYLDRHFPNKPQLIPEDLEQALEVRSIARIIDVYINRAC
jgi:glutathione S-transferase